MLSAAKEEMLSAFAPWSADECISAFESEGKKPHQGVAPENPALHQGIAWSNSTTALGLRGMSLENGVRSRCTGKERDTESGLDNFGARYNASTMGRFMTPDPLPWVDWQHGSDRAQRRFQSYINNPQNFNMYAYVRNNPTNLTDPTGMYVCKGTKGQCAAIQAGLDKAKEALKGNDLNKQQKGALQKVIGFYGKAGDANGVVVQFGKTGAGTGGDTDSSKVFNANITTITFSPTKFAGLSTLQQAEEEVHEGTHGIDGVARGGRDPANKTEEMATERNAYRTQSFVPQGLGVADGGWGLWDPTSPAAQAEGDRNTAVESNAQKSTAAWCAAGGDCQ